MTLQMVMRRGNTREGRRRDVRVHRSDKENFVFIVHGHDDEELGLATHKIGPEGVAGSHEIVRVTCCGGIAHLGEFLNASLVTGDDVGRSGHVENQVALGELDLPHRAALHELFPSSRPAATVVPVRAGSRGPRGILVVLVVVVLRHGGSDLGHFVLGIGIKMCLGTCITALV